MIRKILIACLLCSGVMLAQPPQEGPGRMMERGGPRTGRPAMVVPPGRWWKNAEVVKTVGLTDDQVQRIEKIFTENRLKLVDVHANLEKEEMKLEPLLEADTPDEAAVLAAIDRITAARAAVEKANAQMGFTIRRVLTPEQWKKLRSLPPPRHRQFPGPMPGPRERPQRGAPPEPPAPAEPANGPGSK